MTFLSHYFYGVENPDAVEIPLPLVLVLFALWIGVMVLIVVDRRRLSALKNPMLPARIVGLFLLLDQITLYLWQFLSGYFNVELSLPLYHCRIATPLLILDLVFGITVLRHIWIYWGFLGSFFSMAFMDLYRFDFPHYTNFQFFYLHMILGWMVFYAVFALGYRFEKKGLKIVLVTTFVYNIGLIIFNGLCNGSFIARPDMLFNYGYMLYPPGGLKDFVMTLPPFVFNLLMLVGYELLILLLYAGGRALNRINDRQLVPQEA